ncbi:unnamed protein product [Phaedon cochleariae]|uniref:Uncharacterized protein n=1 Tax=Phaedon cochleariae TaxID=80249 RepID=A0A9N9SP29_PHACE|nr:unnamed protein product [Phaedon cochleariae]
MTLEDKPILRRQKLQSKDNLEIDTQSTASAAKLTKNEYTFSSSPRALYNNRKMVSSNDNSLPYSNIMFEKRVFRGSNFAPNQCHGDGEASAARAAEAKRRRAARSKAKNQQIKATHLRLGSPPAVTGRKHERVQTEIYLEELFVNPPVKDTCTQTDLFLERPVSPFYVPAKTGADRETQIYPGDLFDFDLEVQPILEVLVGKTIEQALIEVLEEEELAALREERRRFLEIRAAETAEALRLEEREKRLTKEKERRIQESQQGLQTQKEMEERIAGAVLMQGYMADLLPSVLSGLESEGYLMDSIRKDLDEDFMPWLIKEVSSGMQEMVSSRDILTDIVREILEDRAEIYQALDKERAFEEPEEEGATVEDLVLKDHMRLQEEITRELEGGADKQT